MRTTRTALATTAALAALLTAAGAGAATADSATPSAATTAKAAKGPAGDGAHALCKRVPKIDSRISRSLKRLNGPASERGSVARLQKRVDNAKAAGHTAIATYLNDKLTFRKSLVPTLGQRATDLSTVRTWCAANDKKKPAGAAK